MEIGFLHCGALVQGVVSKMNPACGITVVPWKKCQDERLSMPSIIQKSRNNSKTN